MESKKIVIITLLILLLIFLLAFTGGIIYYVWYYNSDSDSDTDTDIDTNTDIDNSSDTEDIDTNIDNGTNNDIDTDAEIDDIIKPYQLIDDEVYNHPGEIYFDGTKCIKADSNNRIGWLVINESNQEKNLKYLGSTKGNCEDPSNYFVKIPPNSEISWNEPRSYNMNKYYILYKDCVIGYPASEKQIQLGEISSLNINPKTEYLEIFIDVDGSASAETKLY